MPESHSWIQELVRSIELACTAHQQQPEKREEKALTDAIEASLSSIGFMVAREYTISIPAMLFLKVGEDDGSGCKLKKRSDPVGGARVDIWQSPTGTYIVGIASTEYGGKDVRTGIKLWEEAECEFDRRVSLLKIRKGGKVWHPPYAHRVDLLIHKPNEQALVCAMLEVEIGKVKKKSPGLDQQSHSNFGEDVTLMGWVINNRELPITVVVVMLDTDSLSSAQEAVKRCEKEAKRIKDNLFNDLSGCYIYFATSCPSGFKPCWWPHEPG